MIFNSLSFAAFFVVVFSLYMVLNHKGQNRLLLVASYVFYGTWNWKFLSLILLSTVIDYVCGLKIQQALDQKTRKHFLLFSIASNLSILGFFKYSNFFVYSFSNFLNRLDFSVDPVVLGIILPVGISFYTFQTMSYTIDVYRKEVEPTRVFLDYALYVSFFPQLVAGPIERAKKLLPQVTGPRTMTPDKFAEGVYLIFWGLFQKIFIADNLAKIVNPIFSAPAPYNGIEVLLAVYAFAFQIYCDFAGYSNIARGLSKCMGFELIVNFNLPYFATNPSEFWRRWHISLSNWLRDYLYIPLGGNRGNAIFTLRNLAITMLLAGLWHGAAWSFILWGAYHGLLLILHRLFLPVMEKIPYGKSENAERIWFFIRVVIFFHLVCFGWLIFRAQSINQIVLMTQALIFSFTIPADILSSVIYIVFFVSLLQIVQVIQYRKNDLMIIFKWSAPYRTAFILLVVCLYLYVMAFGQNALIGGGGEFIYFQF